jgi:hypothetical protein
MELFTFNWMNWEIGIYGWKGKMDWIFLFDIKGMVSI